VTRHLHLDPIGGVAGDMMLAALVDLGAPAEALTTLPKRLGLDGVRVTVERVSKHQISASHVRVQVAANAGHRHLGHIRKLIEAADLPQTVRENSRHVFERLAAAEARVHDSDPEKVHFHEVGADDALVDIIGACLLLDGLHADRITCGALPVRRGVTRAAHGAVPLPAPAVMYLAEGWPLIWLDGEGEMVTPTGAALVTTLAESALPAVGSIRGVGYGAGTADPEDRPNLLRAVVFECDAGPGAALERIDELVAAIDDATGEQLAFAAEILLGAGALDAYYMALVMKKGRPGWQLTVLCKPDLSGTLSDLILKHTSTGGVRRRQIDRRVLRRSVITVSTSFGEVRIKEFAGADGGVRPAPEYDDCKALAVKAGVAVARVQEEAIRIYLNSKGEG